MLIFKDGIARFRETTSPVIDVVISGDLCPVGKAENLIKNGKSEEIASDLTPVILDSDLSIVQFEAPLVDDIAVQPIAKNGPNIKVCSRSINLIKAFGFDITLLANNHIGDYGPQSVLNTITKLRDAGLMTVGAGVDLKDSSKILKVERKKISLAIMNVAENEFGGATGDTPGANPLRVPENIIQIMQLKKKFDIVLVIIHGGNEYMPIPSPRMKSTYRAFADAGANAVINIHTHCVQGIELWHEKPIIYSLGNFYFPPWNGRRPPAMWYNGYSAKLSFDHKGAVALKIIPHSFKSKENCLRLLKDKALSDFYNYLAKISTILVDEKEASKYYDAWCFITVPPLLEHMNQYLVKLPIDFDNFDNWKPLLFTRNLHTCETHNETLTHFLRMIGEKRLYSAEAYVSKLKQLQNCYYC